MWLFLSHMSLHDKLMYTFVLLSFVCACVILAFDLFHGKYDVSSFPLITGVATGGVVYNIVSKVRGKRT